MATDQFDDLLERMPKIADVVNGFNSEAVQVEVYHTLVDALDGSADGAKAEASINRKQRKKKRAKKQSDSAGKPNEPGNSSSVDTNDIVNILKERSDFGKLASEVIHKKGDRWNTIRLIMYFADSPMTSGEIFAVLCGLDVKTSLPSVSVKLKAQHASLIASGVRKKGAINTYKLSGPARIETENWLDEIIK